MKYSLGEAAKATGKSKTTIHRALASGKISGSKNDDGEYEIDPSELMRVYEIVTPEPSKRNDVEQSVTADETPVLRVELEGLKAQLALVVNERDDLRRRLDDDSAERRRLTLLITEQASRPEQKPGLWKRIWGS